MSARMTRDAPTAPRRIHATDDEWARMRAAAERAGTSVSAYAVQACFARSRRESSPDIREAIEGLTTTSNALTALADLQTRTAPSLAQLDLFARLADLEDRLCEIVTLLRHPGGRGKAQ